MALYGPHVYDETFTAGEDLSESHKHIAKMGPEVDTVVLANNASDRPIGVFTNNSPEGFGSRVRLAGLASVVSDGSGTAIEYGDFVNTNAQGKAVRVTSGYALGRAYDRSDVDGKEIRVLVHPLFIS